MPEASEKLVGEMDETEFNALIERFIEREAGGAGAVPVEVFFERGVWYERLAVEPVQKPRSRLHTTRNTSHK